MVPLSERGISTGAEIKPFSEVSPEEIARRTGGDIEYFQGDPFIRINYEGIGAEIRLNSDDPDDLLPGQKTASVLIIYGERNLSYPLDSTAVILGERSVTFVYPRRGRPFVSYPRDSCTGYLWVEVSGEKITSYVRAVTGRDRYRNSKRWRAISPEIREAAELATRGLSGK